MTLSHNYTLSDDVVAREVGDETMLLDLASGTYFGLNPVGGLFWKMLEEGRALAEARAALLEEFDVDEATLDQDLSALLTDLVEKGLVSTAV